MKKQIKFLFILLIICAVLSGCGQNSKNEHGTSQVEWSQLSFDKQLEIKHSQYFTISYSGDDYKLLTISNGQKFLVVSEKAEVPKNVDSDVAVLKQPLDSIYLVATNAMDYFAKLDAVKNISLSSQKESGWYIQEAIDAMKNGSMVYAGRYSAPDYETILAYGCDLAVENTMIYHTPEVKEKLEKIGVPVLVDHSSYEVDPLGKMEWIKFYSALFNKEDEAIKFFEYAEKEVTDSINDIHERQTVGFFSIKTNGTISIYKPGSYVAKAIDLAGGIYLNYDYEEDDNALATTTIQMESFYAGARDADLLIYNSTIEGELETLDQLVGKDKLLKDFKAVKNGNVWCIEKNFYQQTLAIGDVIAEIHSIISGTAGDGENLNFLHKLK